MRSLVTCGCGVVRNDEDALHPYPIAARYSVTFDPITLRAGAAVDLLEHYEPMRICRGCGGIYMLPKQTEPTKGPDDAK